jgi:predicted phosphodiesterase
LAWWPPKGSSIAAGQQGNGITVKEQLQKKDSACGCPVGNKWIITRRDFLKASVLAGLSVAPLAVHGQACGRKARIRFGIVADPHYADADPQGNRHYRESACKMAECVELMNDRKVDFLIELGDFKDQDSPPIEKETISYLRAIERLFKRFKGARYHVIGNHDVDSISKKQFLANIKNTNIARDSSYYSFDSKGVHFTVLDANYRGDGSAYDHGNFDWRDTHIPGAQLKWLKQDIAAAPGPVIVFVHQQLDGEGDHCVNNADEVRDLLQASGKVPAVFQGHNHKGSTAADNQIEGIHYYTLKAMVEGSGPENNSYAVVEVLDGNPPQRMIVTGYRRAVSKKLS